MERACAIRVCAKVAQGRSENVTNRFWGNHFKVAEEDCYGRLQ
jgi:hypothetical protein